MKKKYELGVKGINNYPDKITVTVALEIGGYPSLLLPNVAISLDRWICPYISRHLLSLN
ncbi:DUF1327 domain-containing protein, partial [Escherichia coli]|uniref:DUF1327 domain-containing protein n=1 Tax=Escherichia coli TaxID=562 RepID=UPI0012FFF267